MEDSVSTPTMQAGWYWHQPSQRPAYVYQDSQGWHARFLWADPERFGSVQHDGLLNRVLSRKPVVV